MNTRHSILTVFCLALIGLILTGMTLAQRPSAHPGIDLYKAGKMSEAATVLSLATKEKAFEANAEIWSYLGLSYIGIDDNKNARKALEKAVKLSPEISYYHSNLAYVYMLSREPQKAKSETKKAIELDPKNIAAYYLRGSANLWQQHLNDAEKDADQAISIDPAYSQGYVLKSDILMSRLGERVAKGSDVRNEIQLLKNASDLLHDAVEKCKTNPNRKLVDEEFESVNAFYKYFSKEKPTSTQLISDPEPGVTPLKIVSKPKPGYTDSARQANVQGTITMAVLFAANGTVQHILLLKRLGNGLDENARRAARNIKFEPMQRDGKAVSVVKLLEYGFSIY